MKNLINALSKMEKVLINETGIAAISHDFNMKFVETDFMYSDEDTRILKNKKFKDGFDIIDNNYDNIELIKDNVIIYNKDQQIKIKATENKYTFTKEFKTPEQTIKVSSEKLIECLDVCKKELEFLALHGVRIDKYGYTATDSYRLYNIKDNLEMPVTIPYPVIMFLKDLKSWNEIEIEKKGPEYRIKLDYGYLYFRPTELAFPDAANIINAANTRCDLKYSIKKEKLEKILKKCMKISSVKNKNTVRGTIFEFKNKDCNLSCEGIDMEFKTNFILEDGSSELLKVMLDHKYLQSALKRIKSGKLELAGINSSTMITIKGDDETRIEIIMPLALRD